MPGFYGAFEGFCTGKAEIEARKGNEGIWRDGGEVAPWDWRKR